MHSLKQKFIIITCMICIICIGVTAGISYRQASIKLKDSGNENATLLAKKSAIEIDSWINSQSKFLETIAATLELQENLDFDYLCNYLSEILEKCNKDGYLYDIYFTYPDSRMASGSGYIPDGTVDFTQRDWYVKAKNNGIIFEPPYLDVDSGKIVITIARSIEINGTLSGILAEDIFVDTVVDITNSTELAANSYAFLIDNNQGLVVHPNEAYGYVNNEPTALDDLPGAPYQKISDAISSGNLEQTNISLSDYDNTNRKIFLTNINSCGWVFGIAMDQAILKEAANSLIEGFAVAIVISLIIGVIIISILIIRILKPIEILTKKVNSRDITEDIVVTQKDEIGELASGFNEMLGKLRGLLHTSIEATKNIGNSADQLNDITSQIIEDSQKVDNNMDSVVAIMENQYKNIQGSNDVLQDFDSKIDQFSQNFHQMETLVASLNQDITKHTETIQELEESTRSSSKDMENIYSNVITLEENSRNITNIVSTIANISKQTNLLAMNASIEASRAGEAGKGFAVVAQEIRLLSTQTQEASADINQLILNIQASIKQTAEEIRDAASIFTKHTQATEEVSTLFTEMMTTFKEMDGNNQKLFTALETFIEGKNHIQDSIQELYHNSTKCIEFSKETRCITNQQENMIHTLKDWSLKLQQLSEQLKETTDSFRITMTFKE